MKATELRIGNLVQCYRKAFDIEKTQHKVSCIFFLDEFGVCVELEDGFIININEGIEPIPLTEEWLLKFGFEKNGNKYKKNTINIEIRNSFISVMLNNSYSIIGLRTVHQLQNLYFALTGEELEIK